MKTHPVLIGIVNAMIPGLGYLILKERIVFGWLIFLSFLLLIPLLFIEPIYTNLFFAVTPMGQALEGLMIVLATIAFGYDAYDLARRKRATITIPTVTPSL